MTQRAAARRESEIRRQAAERNQVLGIDTEAAEQPPSLDAQRQADEANVFLGRATKYFYF